MKLSELDVLLNGMMKCTEGVSDLNFTVGRPYQVEAHGELKPVKLGGELRNLTAIDTEEIANTLVGGDSNLQKILQETGACDCAYALPDGTRFRVNVFKVRGNYSIVLRVLPIRIPTLQELNLPAIFEEITQLRNGMVLVTGSTGSGKSTTLASIIDRINATRGVHIVTLEDPIEFGHPHKKGTINQRELGLDFPSFHEGLRAALRQAPKVILVGEMRDRPTVEIALKAAETGHLVLSTLHTIDAGQTINRIMGMFEPSEQRLIRSRVSQVLRFVIGQRLLPKKGGGRVAAMEIMGTNLRVRELILSDEDTDKTFYGVIADSRPYGWQTFDQHIIDLFEKDLITEEVAKSYCTDASVITLGVDQIRAARGEDTSDLGPLEMAFTRKIRRS